MSAETLKEEQQLTNYDELVSVMDESFNFKLDFSSMDKEEFLQFCRYFFNGETEYRVEEGLKKYAHLFDTCKKADKQ